MLKDLQNLVNEMNQTNSVLDKKAVLKKYPQCQELLKWVYSPFTQFNVTSKNLKKRTDLNNSLLQFDDITVLLSWLNDRKITGHDALAACNQFINNNSQYSELIYNILDKNLKIRIDAKTINKIFPGCIPTFDVALANKYEDQEKKIDFTRDKWFASRKLDGVRCLAIPTPGGYKLFSRQGKEFLTLDNVKADIRRLADWEDYVFDGEVCIVDDKGNEDFQSIVKEIRRKDHTISNPKFKIFDLIEKEHFGRGESPKGFGFAHRRELLDRLKDDIDYFKLQTPDVIDQIVIESKDHLTEMMASAVKEGWEGLIIRKDAPYKGKRSNDLLKVKKMHDAEYVVNDVEMGPFRVIVDGREVTEDMLSAVMIEHKGNVVRVGSGFSIDQRRHYFLHPDEIIGRVMTVQYFEESRDQNGKYSLRFPVVKHIYEEGREF